ncbi:MAG: DNA repair protein RadC [Taibaiella sp.]|nr:DNA repair protein RadC [Taibaiella sp.]
MSNNNSNSIKNWAEDDRPREKMMQKSAQALSDAELLAILIQSGTREKSALDLAREVLALANNNLHELGRLGVTDLQKPKGIGVARAITIAAALELGRRRQMGEGLLKPAITGARDAAEIVLPLLRDLNHEVFWVLYLNASNRMLKHEILSQGGFTGTVADIRMILKNALMNNANQLIIAHNHPSGNPKASAADKELTKRLKEAAILMDMKLLDHLIVFGNEYMSMADEGMM